MLYQMATGRNPFRADNVPATLHRIAYDAAPPMKDSRPELPAAFTRIVAGLLEKQPGKRPQNLRGVTTELQALTQSTSAAAEHSTVTMMSGAATGKTRRPMWPGGGPRTDRAGWCRGVGDAREVAGAETAGYGATDRAAVYELEPRPDGTGLLRRAGGTGDQYADADGALPQHALGDSVGRRPAAGSAQCERCAEGVSGEPGGNREHPKRWRPGAGDRESVRREDHEANRLADDSGEQCGTQPIDRASGLRAAGHAGVECGRSGTECDRRRATEGGVCQRKLRAGEGPAAAYRGRRQLDRAIGLLEKKREVHAASVSTAIGDELFQRDSSMDGASAGSKRISSANDGLKLDRTRFRRTW